MLAYEKTGKYVSERHAEASAEGKLTAGQMATKIKSELGVKVSAAELKPFGNEWHHSGFYKGARGNTMGRTWFFDSNTDLAELLAKVEEARKKTAAVAAEPDVVRYFFSANFRQERGRYGRKVWIPIANLEAITCKPADYFMKKTEISKADYEMLLIYNGRDIPNTQDL